MIPLMGCHDDIIDIYNKSWKHISTTKLKCVVILWLEYVYYPGTILILNMESVLDDECLKCDNHDFNPNLLPLQ